MVYGPPRWRWPPRPPRLPPRWPPRLVENLTCKTIHRDPDNQTWHRPSSNYSAQVLSFSSLQESFPTRPSKEIESLDKHRCAQRHFRCCSALVKESIVGDGDGDGGDDDDVGGDGDGVESIMMMMQVPEGERGGC